MAAIELKNLRKKYDNGFEAVKCINLEIEKGEFTVLVGPSGCGKSTLLKMIAGLEEITSGDLLFNGVRVNDTPPKDRNIGMVFQNYALYPHMTIRENIAFPLKVAKTPKAEIKTRVEETAELVDIIHLLDRKPKEISGGQRQRAALARAIVRDPAVFLFDEPLSNLDALLRVQMRLEIGKLHKRIGATSIYVTHDQVEAITLGEKIVVMDGGSIMQVGTPNQIYGDPDNLFVATFIGQPTVNLVEGTVIDSKFRSHEGSITLNLEAGYRDSEDVTLAIRPEHLYEVKKDSSHPHYITVSPTGMEDHGHEEIFFFEIENNTWAFRSSERQLDNSIKKTLRLVPETHKIMLFSKEGKRIKNRLPS